MRGDKGAARAVLRVERLGHLRGAAHLHGEPRDVRYVVRDVCARRALLAVVHDPPQRARERVAGVVARGVVAGVGAGVGSGSPRERARVVARGGVLDHREERHEEARGRARGWVVRVRIPAGCPRGLVERRERVERVPGDATRAVGVAGCEIRLGDVAKRERELAQRGDQARDVVADHRDAMSRTATACPRGRPGRRRVVWRPTRVALAGCGGAVNGSSEKRTKRRDSRRRYFYQGALEVPVHSVDGGGQHMSVHWERQHVPEEGERRKVKEEDACEPRQARHGEVGTRS